MLSAASHHSAAPALAAAALLAAFSAAPAEAASGSFIRSERPKSPSPVTAAVPEPAAAPAAPAPAATPSPANRPAAVPARPSPSKETPAAPALERAPASGGESWWSVWIADRLTIGLGIGATSLTDNTRRADRDGGLTYIGFVNHLENRHATIFVPEATWWAARNLRVRLTADSVDGYTKNYGQDHHSDGTVRLRGPLLEVEFLWPTLNDTLFPHAGIGVAWERSEFDSIAWWRLGYIDHDDWVAAGRPSAKRKEGRERRINVDDDWAYSVSAGIAWRPVSRLQIDATVRHVWIEPYCEFGYWYPKREKDRRFEKERDGNFWMDHLLATLTASWVF